MRQTRSPVQQYFSINFLAPRAFALTFLSECFWPPYIQPRLGSFLITPTRFIGLFAVITVAIWAFRNRSLIGAKLFNRTSLLIFGLFGTFALLRLASLAVGHGIQALMFRELIPLGFYLVLSCILFTREANIRVFVKYVVLASIVMAVYVIPEFLLQKSPLLRFAPRDGTFLFAIMDKSRGGLYRAQGAFTHPLLLVDYCIFATLAALMAIRWKALRISTPLALISLTCAVLMALASSSRTALLAPLSLIIYALLLALYRIVKGRAAPFLATSATILMAIGLVVVITQILPTSAVDFLPNTSDSTWARTYMLREGLQAVEAGSFLGYGPGLGAYMAAVYTMNGSIASLDNYWLLVALESGPTCALALIVGLVLSLLISINWAFGHRRNVTALLFCTLVLLTGIASKSIQALPYLHMTSYIAIGLLLNLAFQKQTATAKTLRPAAGRHAPIRRPGAQVPGLAQRPDPFDAPERPNPAA